MSNVAMPKFFIASLLFSAQVFWAQSPTAAREPGFSSIESGRMYQEQIFEKWALDPEAEKQTAAKRQADAQLREFYVKAHRFVELWRTFALDLSNQTTFNAKLAKQVSKAFHDLEKSDGWPVGRSK